MVVAYFTVEGKEPNSSFGVGENLEYLVIRQAIVGGEVVEVMAVVAGNTVIGAEPNETVSIFTSVIYDRARKTVADIEIAQANDLRRDIWRKQIDNQKEKRYSDGAHAM